MADQGLLELAACPFCGGPAAFECVGTDMHSTWSVGCSNPDVDCIGFQMVARFSRKSEAAAAWNTRALAAPWRAEVTYVLSEPHMSGHRVVIGFETLEATQRAQSDIAGCK